MPTPHCSPWNYTTYSFKVNDAATAWCIVYITLLIWCQHNDFRLLEKKNLQRLFRRLIKTIQACHQCQPYTFSHISTYSLNDKHLQMSKTCHWNTFFFFFNIIEVSILCFECIFGNCREPMKWVCPLVSQDALTVALTEETTKEKKPPKKTQGYKMEKQMHDYGLSLSWNPPVTPPATV